MNYDKINGYLVDIFNNVVIIEEASLKNSNFKKQFSKNFTKKFRIYAIDPPKINGINTYFILVVYEIIDFIFEKIK